MSDSHGMVWWTELMTRDLNTALAYYGATCGWTFEVMPMPEGGDYHIGMRGGVPTVGLMDMTGLPGHEDRAPYWMSYFAVEDVDAACAATAAAGGKVIRPPFVIPGTGRIALLVDPTGAELGLMTPEPMS